MYRKIKGVFSKSSSTANGEAGLATRKLGGAHPEVRSPNMFGDNNFIQGGTFTLVNNSSSLNPERPGFKTLQQHVAHAAFHNSVQQVDPPRCHPETRVEILKRIYDWINQSEDREHWLLWLNGAAGAGKSALMRTIVERCIEENIAIGAFFFGRLDATRNIITPLVATLAYQLVRAIPDTVDDVLRTIEQDPLIFRTSIEDQFRQLIIQPLMRLPKESWHPFVVFIDGLDECVNQDHQINLIKVLSDLSSKNSPAIFALASRRESQILSTFWTPATIQLLEVVPLDESEASNDIRRYLNSKFAEIKETHQFRHRLPQNWPSVSVVTELVEKASGQFIFASVVIRFLSSPRANPARQLEIICDPRLHDPSTKHPLTHLDALYHHIFSQVPVDCLGTVLDILAFKMLTGLSLLTARVEPVIGDLEVLLTDLAPVLRCERQDDGILIEFLHASLPDFLCDRRRSQKYFVNLDEYCTTRFCMLFKRPVDKPLSDNPIQCEDCGLTFPLRKDTGLCLKCSKLATMMHGSSEYRDIFVCFQ